MGLSTLPPEIISKICRFLGLYFTSGHDPIRYRNTDFKSLRMTCRALYNHTKFDAGVRYDHLLKVVMIDLTHLGLCQLLHIASIPEFRDRIEEISFHVPEREEEETWGESGIEIGQLLDPVLVAVEEEEVKNYLESSEAVYLLSECLRRLKQARSLKTTEFYESAVYHTGLAAVSLSQFPRQIATFRVEPKQLLENEYRALAQSPATFSRYIKGLIFDTPYLLLEGKFTLQKMYQAKANNYSGYHFSDYTPNHPKLMRFLSTLSSIEHLSLYGPHRPQRLRLCYACHDLFALNIAIIHYPALTKLEFLDMYISGSRLRRFIKNHTTTLINVYFNVVNLTDGSWKSIAQGLLKLPKLNSLCLGFYLCQKTHSPLTDICSASPRIGDNLGDDNIPRRLNGCINIQRFLSLFIEHFQTHKYVPVSGKSGWTGRNPTWYQVTQLKFPGIVEKREPFFTDKCYEAVQIYAKDLLR